MVLVPGYRKWQMEKIENSETDLHVCNHLIYDKNDTVCILASI